jgi:hypothetical protein
MMATVEQARELPSPEEVELIDYKLGTFTSDLDVLARRVREAMEGDIPVSDYVFMCKAGIEPPEQDAPDQAALVRLLVFAVDLIHDADTIREHAQEILTHLTADYHERHLPSARRDPEAWRAYKDSVRRWHRERAE